MIIVKNAIRTPDGTVLHSKSLRDYVTHADDNGETYMVDGGNEYFRGSVNVEKATPLHVTSKDPFEVIRKHLTWGTYGKNGDQPLTQIALADMETEHIEAIFKDGYALSLFRIECMQKELDSRL